MFLLAALGAISPLAAQTRGGTGLPLPSADLTPARPAPTAVPLAASPAPAAVTAAGSSSGAAAAAPAAPTAAVTPSSSAARAIEPVAGATQVGYASWYGSRFQGRLTASGQVYDMNQLTAAHRTLPFGTRVRVTNLENGRSIVVTINDRGPFVANRIIDLSRAAAMAIGLAGPGIAQVRLEVLPPENRVAERSMPTTTGLLPVPQPPSMGGFAGGATESAPAGPGQPAAQSNPGQPAAAAGTASSGPGSVTVAAASTASAAGSIPAGAATTSDASGAAGSMPPKSLIVQVGAFRDLGNAVRVANLLQSRGLKPIYERYGELTRVVLPSVAPADVPALRLELSRIGIASILVRRD